MGQRVVRFSDLTNKIIEDDAVARIVIEQHPALENGPVEIEAAQDEIKHVLGTSLDVVSFKVFMGEGSAPETVTMEVAAFNKLADGGDMADVLRRGQPAYPPVGRPGQRQHRQTSSTTRLWSMPASRTGGRPRMRRRRSSATTSTRSTSGWSVTDCGRFAWTTPRW
jgi:hypothetical protein